jgi:hypothetical protein
MEEEFTRIWLDDSWSPPGGEAPKSGCGSTMIYTENVRQQLPRLIETFKIESMLDAPCGDFGWMQTVGFPDGFSYTGGDIVLPLVRDLRARHPTRNFLHLDLTLDRLPDADLFLCRDCLIHFSYRDIARTLSNFLRSNIKYILTTSYPDCVNRDIATGDFRSIDLLAPPFELAAPLERIDDWIVGFPPRALCLWERGAVSESMERFVSSTDLGPQTR